AFASKGSPARPGAWVGASTEFENFNTCLACHGLNKTSSLLSNYDNGDQVTIYDDTETVPFNLNVSGSYSWRYDVTNQYDQNEGEPIWGASDIWSDLLESTNYDIPIDPDNNEFAIRYCIGQNVSSKFARDIDCGRIEVIRQNSTDPKIEICRENPAFCRLPPAGFCPDIFCPVPIARDDRFTIAPSKNYSLLDVMNNDQPVVDPRGTKIELLSRKTALGGRLDLTRFENGVIYFPPENITGNDVFQYRLVDSRGRVSNSVSVYLSPTDSDGDGYNDLEDNCLLYANMGQEDFDADGKGDICDADADNDGRAGFAGEQFASGEQLVSDHCLSCHLSESTGAPLFGDNAAWENLLSKIGLTGLVESSIAGIRSMPSFGAEFTASQLIEANQFLSGLEDDSDPSGVGGDLDLDQVKNGIDNCRTIPNTDQADDDADGVGNACEDNADNDLDGYPLFFDDNDTDNNRVRSRSTQHNSSEILRSERPMALGPVALHHASAIGYADVSIVLNTIEFESSVKALYGITEVMQDVDYGVATDIFSLDIRDVSNSASVIVKLVGNLPLRSLLRTYQPADNLWVDVDANAVSSAQVVGTQCPENIDNYTPGLKAGHGCMRVVLSDGGQNDADQRVDGVITLNMRVMQIGKSVDGGPESSGGALDWIFVLLITGFRLLSSRLGIRVYKSARYRPVIKVQF
ncbi:MAG: c-type cytochrome, partial [Granulosicoccus sp.]|nr:c-type cytochrome [Granulosicoccus sp.]